MVSSDGEFGWVARLRGYTVIDQIDRAVVDRNDCTVANLLVLSRVTEVENTVRTE